MTLGCSHRFHVGCVSRWRCYGDSCPLCRSPLGALQPLETLETLETLDHPEEEFMRVGPGARRGSLAPRALNFEEELEDGMDGMMVTASDLLDAMHALDLMEEEEEEELMELMGPVRNLLSSFDSVATQP